MRTKILSALLLAAASACRSELLCPAGETACGDRCVSLLADPANCGACGRAVGALEVCSAGVAACAPGLAVCGGACTDLARDATHCGACDVACGGAAYCTAAGGTASCTPACAPGLTACGRACVDLATDRFDCGACGRSCAAGETCRGGACRADLHVSCYATGEIVPVGADLSPAGTPRPVAGSPGSLAVVGGAVYAANGYPASLSVVPLDPALPLRSTTLTGDDLEHVAPHAGVLLVTNASTGTLVVLSPAGAVLGEIPMPGQQSAPNPHGVDVAGTTAYVSLYGNVAGSSGQAVAKVDLGGLSACASGAGPCGSVVGSVDLRSVPGASTAPGLPLPSEVAVAQGRVYVTLANLALDGGYYVKPAGHGKLAEITPGAPDRVAIVDLGASCANPGALALHGTTLWVACGSFGYPDLAPPALLPVELAAVAPAPGAALPVPGIVPGKLAFCAGVGYVTDQGSGAVVRFDPATRSVSPPAVVCPTGPFGFAWAADIACAE
jgi:hypothetical protein